MDRQTKPRTLVFSQRNLKKILPFRCAHFEFEDVISQIDSVHLLTPKFDPSTRRHWMAKTLAYHTPFVIDPGVEQEELTDNYDLFFAICGDPTDLLRVNAIGNWRSRCKTAVCLIDELWVTQMASYQNFLNMLKKFDLVVVYYNGSVEPLIKRTGVKCVFLPPGVDTIRFCPYPNAPQRVVDVYSIGRRSEITHRALQAMAAAQGQFYLHDTMTPDRVQDPIDHRNLFAAIAKRSRYFIVNPGLIDRPDVRGDQIEIGNRYFEAAAAGTIMLGERPNTPDFEQLFDWPDSVTRVPYNYANIAEVVKDLDNAPDKQARMRQTNLEQSLLRHDWVYRWEMILKNVGIPSLPQLAKRKQQLQKLAEVVTQSDLRKHPKFA
jgi:Glycosyl transferases group 1